MSFPSGPCKHITWLKARVAMPWPSSCIGNEAGVAEFQPIEREFLRASTTSSRAFHARYTRRLGIPTTEFLKPRSQCTKLAVVMHQRCNRDFAFLCPLARTKIHSCRRKCRFCTRNRFPLSRGNVLTTRCDSLRHDNSSRSHSMFASRPRTNEFSLASNPDR